MRKGNRIMIITSFIGLAIVLIAAYAVWHFLFGVPNPPLSGGSVTIHPASSPSSTAQQASGDATGSGEMVGIDNATWDVEVASTAVEQARGLSYRPSLGTQDGMLFIFNGPAAQHFWMKDMNFPLDMIWISGNKVAGFVENAPAPASGTALWSLPVYSSPDGVDKVLEVNAGSVKQYGIRVGDAVTIASK